MLLDNIDRRFIAFCRNMNPIFIIQRFETREIHKRGIFKRIDIAVAKEEGRSEYGAAVPRHNNRVPHTAELADDFIELGPLGLRAQDLPETASNYNAGSDPGPLLMGPRHILSF